MLIISQDILTTWSDRLAIADLVQAEHDFRLTSLLGAIRGHSELREKLAFKGGTALNKVYFGERARLSVDLDFNAVGPNQEVARQGKQIRNLIESVLRDQGPNYKIRYKYSQEQTTVTAHYAPLAGTAPQPVKVEISMRESVPILGLVERSVESPDGTTQVRTYNLDELVSTKIRALYARKKGRDIYDLDQAYGLGLDRNALRKMTYFYFYLSGKVFNWNVLKANLEEKLQDRRFGEDIKVFLRRDISFDPVQAGRRFLERFSFLGEPDSSDEKFLALAKVLVGRTKSPKKIARGLASTHPVKELMGSIPITSEAAALTVRDLQVWRTR